MTDATRRSISLERDADQTRSHVADTFEELRSRLSPDSVLEYGSTYLRGPGGERLLGAVRENPIAAVIAAAGLGWLLYTASRLQSRPVRADASDGRLRGTNRASQQGGSRPGVMGDWSEEQNLNQPGDPGARITRQEVEAAFGQGVDATGR